MKINEPSKGLRPSRQVGFTLRKQRERVSAFTLMELVVVIAVIAILAGLAAAALASALARAQMNGTMNNARQLYLAQFQMSNDGANTGDANMVWPGDYVPTLTLLQNYVNKVVRTGYIRGGDVTKLLSAPGASLKLTVAAGPPESVTFTGGTAALKVHPLHDKDPSNTVFCTTRNYVYDTTIVGGAVPYGTKGFVVIRKGGDGAVFKPGQATVAGWGNNQQTFQNNVGLKTGDNSGTVTPNDPLHTLIYP